MKIFRNQLICVAACGLAAGSFAQTMTLRAAPTTTFYNEDGNVVSEDAESVSFSSGSQGVYAQSYQTQFGQYIYAQEQVFGLLHNPNSGWIQHQEIWDTTLAGQQGSVAFSGADYSLGYGLSEYSFGLSGSGVIYVNESFSARGANDNPTAFGASPMQVFVDGVQYSPYSTGAIAVALGAGSHTLGVLDPSNLGGDLGTQTVLVQDQVSFDIDGDVVPVPEPATCCVLGLGLVGVLRKRNRK